LEYTKEQNKLILRVNDILERLDKLGVEFQDPQFKLKPPEPPCSLEDPCDECVDWVSDDGCYHPCSALCLGFNCEGCEGFCNIDGGFNQQEALVLWNIGIKVAKTHIHKVNP